MRRWLSPVSLCLVLASLLAACSPNPFVTPTPASLTTPFGTPVAVPSEGQKHTNEGTPLTFMHSPPSSGTHYPTAQRAGVYPQEISPGYWVHSLEHGYVVALVKCTTDCDAIFAQLQTLFASGLRASKFGNVKFVATTYSQPFTDGDTPIALLAWGYELRLPRYDADTIARFYDWFVDKGPEAIP